MIDKISRQAGFSIYPPCFQQPANLSVRLKFVIDKIRRQAGFSIYPPCFQQPANLSVRLKFV
ncbi:MAG: hypothetical protein K2P25_09060, partial [Lachnospiraceae bacterium]|nr:hypothetical protein [Lachnospiraceae bacterium]